MAERRGRSRKEVAAAEAGRPDVAELQGASCGAIDLTLELMLSPSRLYQSYGSLLPPVNARCRAVTRAMGSRAAR
jgi:hypothetical protein